MNHRQKSQQEHRQMPKLIGSSASFQEVLRVTGLIAKLNVPVLILGETGSGKHSIAKHLHAQSNRSNFVNVNCTAIPKESCEALLFSLSNTLDLEQNGYVFQAHKGTLYLQDVSSLTLEAQAQLLYLIDNENVLSAQPLKQQKLDVRIIASSDKDLRKLVDQGKFSADLFYRLGSIPVELPQLADRDDDLLLLMDHFFRRLVEEHLRSAPGFTNAAKEKLRGYNWPGNIQELKNFCERMFLLFHSQQIDVTNLPAEIQHHNRKSSNSIITLPESGVQLDSIEVDLMQQALRTSGGNKSKAARLLGLTRDKLLYRLKKHSIHI